MIYKTCIMYYIREHNEDQLNPQKNAALALQLKVIQSREVLAMVA